MPIDSSMIEVDRLVRKFGDRTVLNDISFNVHRGDTLVIMGGSGCGKSTLLRHMIGSMQPTSGTVKLFGEEVTGMKEREILRIRLRFGMLFQSGALLASLTVGENVALPLLQHTDKSVDEIEEIVEQKLQMVGLTGFEDLRPDEISGGMKKRVGLARALALDPELLFSDEPTSGLDPIMTAVIDELTLKLTRGKGMTAVVVSHDMTSAFRIATRMIMLGHGGIVAQGTPDEIRASSNPEVQQFIKGEPDGPIPLNLSQEEHEHHQHVKPRPFPERATDSIARQDEAQFVRLFRRAVCDRLQRCSARRARVCALRTTAEKTDANAANQLRRCDRHKSEFRSALRRRAGGTRDRNASPHRTRARSNRK